MNKYFEQSESYEQVKVATKKTLEPSNPLSQPCLFRISLGVSSCQLLFTWNFRHVNLTESSYVKHILFLDMNTNEKGKTLFQICAAFNKFLKLGDFLKIVHIKQRKMSNWLQKTNKDLSLKDYNQLKQGEYFTILHKTLNNAYKYDEYLSISVILGHEHPNTNTIAKNINQILKVAKTCYKLNYFIFTNVKTPEILCQSQNLSPQIIYQSDQDLVEGGFKTLFSQFVRLRAQKVEIYLTCCNAQLNVRSHQNSQWKRHSPHTLTRRLLNLNNYAQYCERLVINSCLDLTHAEFKIKFITKTIQGMTYQTQQHFKIELKSVSHKHIIPFSFSDANPLSTMNSIPSSFRNSVLHCEQISLVSGVGRSQLPH